MQTSSIVKIFLLWLLILLLAMGNGAVRELQLIPRFGLMPAMIVSGLLLCTAIVLVSYFLLRWCDAMSARQRWLVGAIWLLLTLSFEFGFGHFVQRHSWQTMLQAYTFTDGNLWPLVLLTTACAPRLVMRFKKGESDEC